MIINPTSVEDTESMDDEASLSPSLEIDDDPSSCFVLSDDHVLSYRSFQVRMNPEDVKDKVFLAIVKALLKMGNRPCTPKELSECIQKHKFAALGGNTPYATVSSRISQHFKRVAESRPHPRPALLGKQNVSSLRKLGYFVNQKGVSVDFQIATSKPHTSESDDSSDVPVDELQPTEQPPAIANPVMADSARVHTAPSALAPASSAISAVHTISTPSIERRPNLAGALAFSPSTDSPDSSGKLPAKNGVTRPFRVNGALKDAARAATKRKRIATGMQEDPLEPVRSSKPASARKRASVAPVVDEPHKPPDCGAESDEEIDIMSVDDDVLSTTSAIPSSNAGDAQATPTGSRQIAPRVPTSQPNPFDDAAPSDQPPILGISLSDSVSGEAAASGSNSTQSEMDLQLRKNDQQCPPNASSPKHAVLVSSLSSADLGSKSEASNVDPGCISAATPQPSTAGITVPSASATLSSVLFPQAPNFNGYIPDPATSTSDRTAPSINRATLRYASSHEAIFMPNMMSPETHRPPTFSDRSPNLAQLPHHGSRSQSNINKGWHMGDPDLYLPSPIGDDASIFGLDEGLRLDLGSSSRHSGGPHSLSSKFVPFVAPIDASYGSVRTASGIQRKRKDSYESGLQMFQRHTSTASLELFESSHKAAKRFKVNPQQHTIKLGDFILRRSFLEAPNGLVEMVVASPLTELPIFTLPWSPRPPILPASAPHFEIFWNHDSSPVQIVQCLVQLTGMVKLRDILLRRIRTTGEEKLLEMRSPAHMDSLSTLAILDAANPALVPPLTAIDLRDRVCWSRYLELLIWLVRESASTTKTLQISGSLVSLDQSFAFDPFGMLAFEGLGPALGAEVDGLHNHLIVWLHGLPGYTSFKDMSLEGIWVSSECAQRLTEEFDLLPVTSEAISLICEGFQTPQAAQSSSLSGDVRAASAPVTGGIDAMAEDEGNAFFVFSEGESEASDDTPDTPMLPAQASSSLLEATSTARPASDPSSGSTAESTSGPSSAAGSVATRLSATEPSLQHESGPAALGPASETTTLGRVRTELLASPFTSGRDELLSETSVLHSRTRQHCPVHLSPSTLDLFPAVENPLHPPTNVWMVEIEGLLCYVTWIPETHRLLSGAGRLGSESMLREGDGREPPTRSPRMQAQSQNITDAALAGASTLQSPRLRGEGETGIPILRRVDNGMVNATLLLYAGGMRTEEERSIALSLEQSKVRCRKADSQLYGTWIPLGRARELARSCCLEAKLSTILGDEIGKIAFRRALSPDSILLPPSVTDLDPPGVNTLGQDCSADCPMLESTTGAEGSPVAQEAGLIQPELRTSSGVGSAAGASVISTASSSGVSPGAEVTLPHISTTPVPNTAQSVPPAVTADKALPAVATAAPSVATVPSRSISVSASASLVGNKPPSLARTSPAKALAPPMSLDGTGPSPAIKSTAAAVVPAALPQSNANEPQRRPGNDGRDALASAVDEPRTAEVVSIPSSASKALSLSATTAVPPSTTLSTTPSTAALTTATAAGLRPPLLTISPRAPSRPTLPTPAPSGAAASTPSTPTITGGAALPPASPAISSLTAAKGTPSTSQPSNTHTLAAAGAAPASQSAPATAAAGTRKPKSRYTAAKKDGPKPGSVAKTTGEPLPGLVRNRVLQVGSPSRLKQRLPLHHRRQQRQHKCRPMRRTQPLMRWPRS
ncbi:uncharacterized protein BJ171DRAFT_107884 [Polychytrium aggregatum]|uniref:uncharacterized protein n=1 Tax=Polychytrium aggregatum TaxID=110093 RepID=UPI0022FF2315|nr:uncharacterized protein BJ171DRAFT_107884 [Polychytrium aggregatum]KAI9204525.1 hypothetical protein BJ171DRAFT_107884 [Polychytrium aggregatum]